jgi:hypothetical protein
MCPLWVLLLIGYRFSLSALHVGQLLLTAYDPDGNNELAAPGFQKIRYNT